MLSEIGDLAAVFLQMGKLTVHGVRNTGLGFLAMMTAGFNGLAQLALFAVSGLLAAALSTRYVLLPTLVLLGWSGREQTDPGRWEHILGPPGWLRAVAVLGGLGCALFLIFFITIPWEDDLAALSPVPAVLIDQDRSLRFELGAPELSHMVVIQGKTAEEVLQHSEKLSSYLQQLVENGELGGYVLPSSLLPSRHKQMKRQEALPDRETLQANLEEALTGLPFKQQVFESFAADVVNSKHLDPLTLDALGNTLLGQRVGTQLFETRHGWLGIVPLVGVKKPAIVKNTTSHIPGFSGFTVNLKEESALLINRFCSSALNRLGIGLGVIACVLVAGLKSFFRPLQVLVPVLLALAVDVTLLVSLGERLSIFHLVSLLLVAGITIDYSLFLNRSGDSDAFRLSTLHAVTICFTSTVIVFGLLALSQVPVLQAIGKTVAFGVLAGFFMSLMIAAPLRRVR